MDHRTVGRLPNQIASSFTNACTGSFLAPEVERDLFKVPNSSLIEAVNFHAASVSGRVFTCIRFVALFLLAIASHGVFDFRRLCSWLGGFDIKGKLFARTWREIW